MGEFPSGQRGQTVNLLRFASMVRIRPPPPQKDQSFRIGLFVRLESLICLGIQAPYLRGKWGSADVAAFKEKVTECAWKGLSAK